MELQVLPAPSAGELQTKTVPSAAPIREDAAPEVLIPWLFRRFAHQRIIVTTQFGMEGCALIHMLARHTRHVSVVYVDTGFFFPETYALRDRLIQRYPHVSFINCGTALTPEAQALEYGPELWSRNPTQCCLLRKVEPLKDVMRDVDVWITGLRRSQSSTRARIRKIEWDWQYHVLKVNPIADWSREQIWEYVRANSVPFNPLHEAGYPSIGCTHCTQRVEGASAKDYSRDGRWSAFDKTECGLHGEGI